MSTVIGWAIGIMLLIVMFGKVANSVAKTAHPSRAKCEDCGTRMKSAPGKLGYAEVCSKCGHRQNWATTG
jgi:tRNA(Ile2) C34 agmatinyltransferase TiaS